MSPSEANAFETVQGLATAEELPSVEVLSELSSREKRVRWFELCLLLLIAFGSYFLSSIYVLVHGPGITLSSQVRSFQWMESVLRESASLMLLGYILWRRGLGFRHLGLRWSLRDPLLGLLLAIASLVVYSFSHWAVSFVYHLVTAASPGGATAQQMFSHPSWSVFPFIILNAFFEELIVRAYLMTEVQKLTGSWKMATASSVAVQTSYHLYYGWIGALSLSFVFLLISIYFARTRKAVPILGAHALVDLYSFIRLL